MRNRHLSKLVFLFVMATLVVALFASCGDCEHEDITVLEGTNATCTTEGLTEGIYCNECEQTIVAQEVVPKTAHTEITIPGKAASCTSVGLTDGKRCSVCNTVTVPQTVIPATEHTWDGANCSVCGSKKTSVGLAYTLSSDSTYYTVSGIGICTDTDIVIPSVYNELPVKEIASNAFCNNTTITEITIPKSITSIGSYAFSGCTGLSEIYYNAASVNDLSSNNYVFYYAGTDGDGIKVTIGKDVKKIPAYLFYPYKDSSYSPKITSVVFEEGSICESIGWSAFGDCSELTSIEIPNSVTSIGTYAFRDCTGLTSVSIGNSVISIGDWAFAGCSGLTSIEIPNSVTWLGNAAFSECAGLTSVKIPNSVTLIDNGAFAGCSGLTSIEIPNSVTEIGSSAFEYCRSLTSIEIPNSVTEIGGSAFDYCLKLIEVINKSTLNITAGSSDNGYVAYYAKQVISDESQSNIIKKDGYIFYNDNGNYYLMGYEGSDTELVLPDNINDNSYAIYNYAFSGCTGLTSIEIPNSVTSIGGYAFYECTGLTSVTIGNSVTSIGEDAFYNCTGLTSVTIGNSVTSIGNYAFSGCTGLTSIEIPNSVTSIGYRAFWSCTRLTSVTFENPNGWYVTRTQNATSGTDVTLTDSSANAAYLNSTYYNCYWYRK